MSSQSVTISPGLAATGARWLWPRSLGDGVNQYAEFAHDFRLDAIDPSAELLISADSNYALWINDAFVDCGQFHDFPDRKTYDRLPIAPFLRAGANHLRILVHYQGAESFQYIKGPPGLIYALRSGQHQFISGAETRYRRCAAYHNGPIARTTLHQLGFTFQFDARAADEASRQPWRNADPAEFGGDATTRGLAQRPLPKLILQPPTPAAICAQGTFRRDTSAPASDQSVAQRMQRAALSQRFPGEMFSPAEPLTLPSESGIEIHCDCLHDDGAYVVIDLGREEAGLLTLDLETDAGTVIDIAHGEHLDDLRVRAYVGQRHFASQYICKAGRQQFMHALSRMGARYLQLHVSGATHFKLHYAGIRATDYPLQARGAFHCADTLHNEIHQTAARTLHLCMHEHYEDCPWREQALYAFDSRNQALYGYYAFGEYPFPATSFGLLADTLADDGYMEMCAPAKIDITIPMFSFAWVLAIDDYWMFSAEKSFVGRAFVPMKRMIDTHLGRMVDSLLPCPVGERYWHFYEWVPGLDGSGRLKPSDPPRFDAPLNLMFCLALRAAVRLAEAVDDAPTSQRWRQAEKSLRQRIAAAFWNRRQSAFASYGGADAPAHYSEFVQSLALLAGIPIPPAAAAALRARLTQPDNGLVPTTLSHCHYKFEALMMDEQAHGKWVFDAIARDWGHMLARGATSFWETIRGGDDFNQAGSLCHGWSAVPVYFYMAYLLGIRPLEPGFARFSVDPLPQIVPSAEGIVPTPYGPIEIAWEKVDDAVHVRRFTFPDRLNPVWPKDQKEPRA